MKKPVDRTYRIAEQIKAGRVSLFANVTLEEREKHMAAVAKFAESMRPLRRRLAKVVSSIRPLDLQIPKLAASIALSEQQWAKLRPVLDRLAADVNELNAKHKPPTGLLDDYVVAAENPKIDPLVRRAWQALFAADLPIGYYLAIAKALPQPFRTRGSPRGHRTEIARAVADVRRRMASGRNINDALAQHLDKFGTGNATRPARRRTLLKALAEDAK